MQKGNGGGSNENGGYASTIQQFQNDTFKKSGAKGKGYLTIK